MMERPSPVDTQEVMADMINQKPERQYQEMLDAATYRLQHIDLKAAAEKSGLSFGRRIAIPTFGEQITLDPATFLSDPPIDMWHHLVILQYLETADDSMPSDTWIGMAELREGGLARGASFDREIDVLIADRLGIHPPEAIRQACGRLGGLIREDTRADLCADFSFMPRFPLRLNLWFADDEFPACGKVLVNDGVKHRLGTEAIGTISTFLVRKLCDSMEHA